MDDESDQSTQEEELTCVDRGRVELEKLRLTE